MNFDRDCVTFDLPNQDNAPLCRTIYILIFGLSLKLWFGKTLFSKKTPIFAMKEKAKRCLSPVQQSDCFFFTTLATLLLRRVASLQYGSIVSWSF